MTGFASGIGMGIWVYMGSRIYPPGQEFVRKLAVSTDKCLSQVSIVIF